MVSLSDLTDHRVASSFAILFAAGLSVMASAQAESPKPETQAPAVPPNNGQTTSNDRQKPRQRNPFYIGPDFGVYLPTSSKTRARFGSAWFDIGGSFGAISSYDRGRFDLDLHLLGHSKGADSVLFGLLGLEYRHPLLVGWDEGHSKKAPDSQTDEPERRPNAVRRRPFLFPYCGISFDLMFANLQSVEENVDTRFRSGFGGAAFLGLNVGTRAYAEARYIKTSEIEGFDLSGLRLSVGYRFRF